MQSVIGALRVILGADTAQFDDGMSKAQAKMATVGKKMEAIGARMAGIGAGMSAAITAPIIAAGAIAVREATEMAHAVGQVNAALNSMGDAAGRNFDQLAAQAEALSATSLFEDDEILTKVTANLLTFGNIASEQFDRAQQAALNLSARMGTDLQSSALMLGKALNDPAAGMAKLSRAGIQFTEEQKAQVKAMQAAGNMAGAQAIMLAELERQFGGAAAAARAADPMAAAMMDIKNVLGELGAIILPVVAKIATGVSAFMKSIGQLGPGAQQMVVVGALVAAAIGPVLVAVGAVVTAVGALMPIIAGAAAALGAFALPIAAAVAAIVLLAVAFKDDIVPALQHFWEELSSILGPKIKPLMGAAMGLFNMFVSAIKGMFGDGSGSILPALKTFGTVVARVFGAVVDVITGALNIVTNIMGAIGALLRGDWSAMWAYLGQAVVALVQTVGNVFATLLPNVTASVSRMYHAVKEWLQTKLLAVFNWLATKIKAVGDFFYELYDRVVGHSYVPDMVNEITAWMAKLDQGMVRPARNATEDSARAFEDLRDEVGAILSDLMTDTERASLSMARDIDILNRALRRGILTKAEYDEAMLRRTTEVMDPVAQRNPLQPLTAGTELNAIVEASNKRQRDELVEQSNLFAENFAANMQRVIKGDISGLFNDMLDDVFSRLLQQIGKQVFDLLGTLGQQGGFWGQVASIFGTMMGGGSGQALPRFNNGGSFKIGGSAGMDNNLVQFMGSRGETVDIHRNGQDRGGGILEHRVIVVPDRDSFVSLSQDANAPAIMASERRAVSTSTQVARRGAGAVQRNMQRLGTT
jgi:hypothetical protein